MWRWSDPCDLAAITIGSNGGRCAFVDALGDMRVTREPRCAAVDVAKDIANELIDVSKSHSYITGHDALLNLSNSRI